MRTSSSFAALAALALLPVALSAQDAPLPLGTFAAGEIAYGEGATFTFQAPGPGFLTVVVRGEDGQDVALSVTDEDHQYLPGGATDSDQGGAADAEQLVVQIPRAGTYLVNLESFTGVPSAFRIGASFLASELAARPEDPDARPSRATELAVGVSREDRVSPAEGDDWDWFRIPITQDGVLTVLTRGEGDLTLEWYEEGAFNQAMDYSDQDMDGSMGNESLTLQVRAGQAVWVRVAPLGGGDAVPYRITSGLIPG